MRDGRRPYSYEDLIRKLSEEAYGNRRFAVDVPERPRCEAESRGGAPRGVSETEILSAGDHLAYAVGILLSLILGAGVVLAGLQSVGLGRFTTGTAGQVAGIAGAFAGLAAFFALLSYRRYRAF